MPTIQDQQDALKAFKAGLEAGGDMTDNPGGETEAAIVLTAATIDADGMAWIEVMPTAEKVRNGSWYFSVTASDLDTLAAYIEANPDRIPIDYDHAGAELQSGGSGSTRAAGWFTGEARVIGAGAQNPIGEAQDHISVWARVKWTPTAAQEIRDGAFRFISPEWHFEEKDSKTGLMTKLKDLAAATLTNRPFFKQLAPVVAMESRVDAFVSKVLAATMDGQTVTLDAEDMTTLSAMDDLLDEILGEPETEDAAAARRLTVQDTILAAQWTGAYINDLPDSAFLYIEDGGEKDSDGKTTPRALRHFPVRDASGNVDLPHVRNALARIPQSSVSAAAKDTAISKAQRLLSDAGGSPSATDQGKQDETKEITVADDQNQVTDYMKMLGLDDTVDPKHRLAAAFRDKDEQIERLKQKVTELATTASEKDTKAEELTTRLEELEQKDRSRDIEVLLASAVSSGRALPSEAETLSEVFADDVPGLKRMLAARPAQMFATKPKGVSGERYRDDPDVAAYVAGMETGGDPVDNEQAKVHLIALDILKDQGKATNYTDEDYVAAYEAAAKRV